jgi:hypothetical protein
MAGGMSEGRQGQPQEEQQAAAATHKGDEGRARELAALRQRTAAAKAEAARLRGEGGGKGQLLLERLRREEAQLEAEEKSALERARAEVAEAQRRLHDVAEAKTDEADRAEREVRKRVSECTTISSSHAAVGRGNFLTLA